MNKSIVVEKYKNACIEYYRAAKILEKADMKESAPKFFLHRHSLELALKAAIISFQPSAKIENLEKIKVGAKKTIASTHSVKLLLQEFFVVEHSLFSTSAEEKDKFMDMANMLDDMDSMSDYFRYPFSKDGLKTNITPKKDKLEIVESGIMPEIKPNSRGLWIAVGTDTAYAVKRHKGKLLDLVNTIMALQEFIFTKIGITMSKQ